MLEGLWLLVVLLIGVFAPLNHLQPPFAVEFILFDELLRHVLALAGKDIEDVEYAPNGAEEVTDCSKHFVAPDQDRNDPDNTRSVVKSAGGRCVLLFNTDMGGG